MATLSDTDPRKLMPECDAFIAGAWMDLGMCEQDMNGPKKLSYQEVKAYSDLVCELNSFEAAAVVKMSNEYITEKHLATEDKMRTCYLEDTAEGYKKMKEFNRAEVSRKMRQLSATAKK
jgi:hypothetical protein